MGFMLWRNGNRDINLIDEYNIRLRSRKRRRSAVSPPPPRYMLSVCIKSRHIAAGYAPHTWPIFEWKIENQFDLREFPIALRQLSGSRFFDRGKSSLESRVSDRSCRVERADPASTRTLCSRGCLQINIQYMRICTCYIRCL